MQVADRYRQIGGIGGGTESLASDETVIWFDPDTDPLRLVEVRDTIPPRVRLEGHGDDAGTFASVRFDSDDAERRARLYLACYLEAGTFGRPPEEPAHSVPLELLTLPRRYHAAYLIGATTNSAEWAAKALSRSGPKLDANTIYAYCSRVRSDHPEVFE